MFVYLFINFLALGVMHGLPAMKDEGLSTSTFLAPSLDFPVLLDTWSFWAGQVS